MAHLVQFQLHKFDKATSTNELVKERISAGESEGYVALAFEQTCGYGTMKKSWASPLGGLYMSILLRPCVSVQIMPTVSFITALSIRRAITHFVPSENMHRVRFKWPNDIVLVGESSARVQGDGCWNFAEQKMQAKQKAQTKQSTHEARKFHKLVGISQELVHGALCIGIGANVFHPELQQDVAGKNTPSYIDDLMFEKFNPDNQKSFISNFASVILDEFAKCYKQWCESGFSEFIDEYQSHMCLRGSRVSMKNRLDKSVVVGHILGIDDAGHLLLAKDVVALSSGEVTLI